MGSENYFHRIVNSYRRLFIRVCEFFNIDIVVEVFYSGIVEIKKF